MSRCFEISVTITHGRSGYIFLNKNSADTNMYGFRLMDERQLSNSFLIPASCWVSRIIPVGEIKHLRAG